MAPARIPHRGEVQLSTSYVNWQLSSNGLQANRDFVNRSLITRILKREPNYKFSHYQTGNILANVKAKQPLVLGAVFRIIKEWFDRGCQFSLLPQPGGCDPGSASAAHRREECPLGCVQPAAQDNLGRRSLFAFRQSIGVVAYQAHDHLRV